MLRPRAHGVALAVVLGAAVITLPGVPFATLSPSEDVAGVDAGGEQDLERLTAVRERLARQTAMRRALDGEIGELEQAIEALRLEREQTDDALERKRDQALALERRLDWLVPRLAARVEAVEGRREQAAHALADLAGLSRQVEIDPAIRARLLAVSPLMLERLRSADASLTGLRRERDRLGAEYRTLLEQAPVLLARRQQLERQRLLAQRRREARLAELERIEAELTGLRREEQVIAQRVIAAEAARTARAEPQSDQPALRSAPPAMGAADQHARAAAIKGVAMGPTALGETVDALRATASLIALASPELPAEPRATAEAYMRDGAPPPPPAKPTGMVTKADLGSGALARDRASLGRNAAVDVALLHPDIGGSPLPALSPGRIARPVTPIMPIPGQVVTGFGDGRDSAAITIAATPGQAVAAPADGRVVFAGRFRSYGLLLIIEHDPEYHTLLWGFSRIDVELGEEIRIGQVVGSMGAALGRVTGVDGGRGPELHVELRRHGRPVNPLPWLAASSSKVRG